MNELIPFIFGETQQALFNFTFISMPIHVHLRLTDSFNSAEVYSMPVS